MKLIALALILAAAPPFAFAADREVPALKDVFGPNFLVGAAIEPTQLRITRDVALLRKHFSSITAENVMKPHRLAPREGQYYFGPADELARFAQANGIRLRGHTLLWHRNAPGWFFAGGDRAEIRTRLEQYVTNVVTHFKGKVYAWDVVNEVASDNPGEIYRETSPWFKALGPDYIEYAFRAARAADPDAQLFINEYDTEEPEKRARLMTIVRDLMKKGVPLDGVGHQVHTRVGASATGVDDALKEVAALGLINHVTELDVSVYEDPGSCAANRTGCKADYGASVPEPVLIAQAALYGQLFDIFRSHPTLRSVSTWGISDAHTWLATFPVTRTNKPLLFDTAGAPKAAFHAIVDPRVAKP
jgi:endo-1,4-beta-xylanase